MISFYVIYTSEGKFKTALINDFEKSKKRRRPKNYMGHEIEIKGKKSIKLGPVKIDPDSIFDIAPDVPGLIEKIERSEKFNKQ